MAPPSLTFSHVGLHAFDPEALAAFYTQLFGFVETDRGHLEGRGDLIFLSRDPKEHHQLVLVSGRTAAPDAKWINQISFRVGSLDELKQLHKVIAADGRAGQINPINHGNAWAVYVHDPEGNRIELFVDTPWYVAQPMAEPLDLERATDTIVQETEVACRSLPGFKPASEFQAEVAAKLARS
jgi:catechol-2,3-dioxygenase